MAGCQARAAERQGSVALLTCYLRTVLSTRTYARILRGNRLTTVYPHSYLPTVQLVDQRRRRLYARLVRRPDQRHLRCRLPDLDRRPVAGCSIEGADIYSASSSRRRQCLREDRRRRPGHPSLSPRLSSAFRPRPRRVAQSEDQCDPVEPHDRRQEPRNLVRRLARFARRCRSEPPRHHGGRARSDTEDSTHDRRVLSSRTRQSRPLSGVWRRILPQRRTEFHARAHAASSRRRTCAGRGRHDLDSRSRIFVTRSSGTSRQGASRFADPFASGEEGQGLLERRNVESPRRRERQACPRGDRHLGQQAQQRRHACVRGEGQGARIRHDCDEHGDGLDALVRKSAAAVARSVRARGPTRVRLAKSVRPAPAVVREQPVGRLALAIPPTVRAIAVLPGSAPGQPAVRRARSVL